MLLQGFHIVKFVSRFTLLMLVLEDWVPRSMLLRSTMLVILLLQEVRRSSYSIRPYSRRSQVFGWSHISLGDDEKVFVWDIATRKRKHLLEDSGRRWGQVTCISWLANESRQDNKQAVLVFGTARGLVVLYRQSRTEVCMFFSKTELHVIFL